MLVTPDAFTEMPRAAMRPLAKWFVDTGEKLHEAADHFERIGRWRETANARIRRFKSAGEVMAAYLAEGRSEDEAMHIVKSMTGLENSTLAEALRYAKGTLARHKRTTRNRHIMKLVRRGWHNHEIATKYDLHPKHVARIIGVERKRAA